MIPEGWEEVSLGDLFEFKNGLNGDKGLYGTGTKFANVMDVFRGPRLMQGDITGSMQVTDRQLQEYGLARGDVLFNRTSETDDEIAMATVFMDDQPAVFGGFVIRARPLGNRLSHAYCSYAFQINEIRRELIKRGQGAVRSNIGQKDLAKVLIQFPPLREQRHIARTLETWDRAIETVEALTANARAQKQALMQQLLPQGTTPPKKRLPGFSGEWREIRLGNAFTERVERGEGGLALLSVTQTSGVVPQEEVGRRNISSNDQSNYKTIRSGDIAYNTMRMWQGASALSNLTGKVSPAYTVVTPRKGHDAAFYAYFFKQSKAIHVFERHSQGLVSDTWSLKFPFFAEIRICVPKFDEQKAIASAFKSADDLMFSYKTQLAALRREKAALMQQLLTGKRRVKLPESEVAA